MEDTEDTRFLPPEPSGPEPELEDAPAQQASPQQTYGYPPPAGPGQAPPAGQPPWGQQAVGPPPGTQGYPPPSAGHAYPPASAGQGYPPPGQPAGQGYPPPPGQPYYPPPPGHGYPPPGPGYPPGHAYPPPWGYAQPAVPDNGQAVAGFVFSLVSLGLLVMSAGLSSVVSIGCAIVGIVCGRNGKRKVDEGKTPKHRGLAQAGFIIGWVSLALAVLATIAWIIFIVDAANDDEFDWDNSDGVTATAVAVRISARLLGA